MLIAYGGALFLVVALVELRTSSPCWGIFLFNVFQG